MKKIINVYKDSRILENINIINNFLGVRTDNEVDILSFKFAEGLVEGTAVLLTDLKDSDGQLVSFPLTFDSENSSYDLVVTKYLVSQLNITIQLEITNNDEVWHSKQAELIVDECLEVGEGEMPNLIHNWLNSANLVMSNINTSETLRVQNEILRQNAETTRSSNEETRISNEELRVATMEEFSSSHYTNSQIDGLLNEKVDKVVNKGLSTNDYTNEDKSKVDSLSTTYSLITETGNKIELEMNNTTFKIKAKLKDKNNNVICTSNEIDLPLESVVVSGSYDSTNKKVILTLQNGSSIEFSVADLVSGLQSEITSSNKLDADLVDDGNATNKFVTSSEKAQITTNANSINSIKDGTNIDSFGDVETALSNKVNKETNKGLSTNDFTNALKTKLDGIEVEANKYTLPTASSSTLGGVKIKENGGIKLENGGFISIDENMDLKRAMNNYIAMTPDYNEYTVKFPLWETSQTSAGEKIGVNANYSITPATDSTAEVNNYPKSWDSLDCNMAVTDDGIKQLLAIKGMSNFTDTGKVDVGCIYRTAWWKIWTDSGYLYISKCYYPKEGYTITPLAINKDGSYDLFYIKTKYVAGDIDGDLYCSKDLIPAHYLNVASSEHPSDEEFSDNVSYSGLITLAHRRGAYYSGGLMSEYMDTLLNFYVQFATRNTQSIMAGNTSNNYQYQVSQVTTNSNRVVITKAQANNIDLLTCVSVGDMGSATDNGRNHGYMHNVVYDARVIGKEDVDENNTALILDHDNFTTTSTCWVSTMHERSGYSDFILGRTGSPISNSNGRHGMVYNGQEIMVGGYEVAGNAICNIINENGDREVYVTNDSTKLSSTWATIQSTYNKPDLTMTTTAKNAGKYITEMGFDLVNGVGIPTKAGQSGASSSTGYADQYYTDNASSGQRELLWLGILYHYAAAGLSCLYTDSGMSGGYWAILARLSINGVGGELAE